LGLCGVLPPLLATYSKSSLWPRLRVAAHLSGRGLRLRGLLGGETITVSGGVRTLQGPRSRRPLQVIPETSLCVHHRLLLSAPARYLLASGGAGPIGPGLCWLLL